MWAGEYWCLYDGGILDEGSPGVECSALSMVSWFADYIIIDEFNLQDNYTFSLVLDTHAHLV